MMAASIQFGWRIPDYPEGLTTASIDHGKEFRDQIFNYMNTIHGRFDSAWAGDHFFPWPAEVDQSIDTLEVWTLLTYLMAMYPKMKFCPGVFNQILRQPSLLAKMGATLQLLSGGRVILGIGAGWKENEVRAYGYKFGSNKERLDQLEEAAQIIRKMWDDKSPTFGGKYYSIDQAYCNPRPDPAPPLLIGGFGPKRTLKIVAKYADWCNIDNSDLGFCEERLNVLKNHCLDIGRNYDSIVKTYICDCLAIAPTREKAEALKNASFFSQFSHITGTPDEVTEQLQAYTKLGFSHIVLRFADYPSIESVRLFIDEVIPRF
jgi:alkanesulfonate monooxygenase SsuD/methylene tetrahydromethanopterin reductase-like flavin-dependent oxidoreductase (luciferase family)